MTLFLKLLQAYESTAFNSVPCAGRDTACKDAEPCPGKWVAVVCYSYDYPDSCWFRTSVPYVCLVKLHFCKILQIPSLSSLIAYKLGDVRECMVPGWGKRILVIYVGCRLVWGLTNLT